MKYYTQSYHKKSPFLSNYFFLVAFELLIFLVFCVEFFVFFVFVLCRVHPKLPVSLDCPFLIASLILSDAYFMHKNPISKEIKYIESSALYFTSLQRFNIGTAGSFLILKSLRHDCQSFNLMIFYSCCKGTKNPEKIINKQKENPKDI